MATTLLDKLSQIKPTDKPLTLKVGGEFWGDLFTMKDFVMLVLDLFIKTGMPKGFVYSAPKGLTRSLQVLLGFSRGRSEQVMQAKQGLELIFNEFSRLYTEFVERLCTEHPLMKKNLLVQTLTERSEKNARELLQIGQEALERYHDLELESGMEGSQEAALILSMGERAFHKVAIAPAFELLRLLNVPTFPDIRFLKPEDLIVPDGQASPQGYVNLLPHVLSSARTIRGAINAVEAGTKNNVTFFMPGYYMSRHEKFACMPFNGSDISAWLFSLALRAGELMYVKRVEGDIPCIGDLMRIQGNTAKDGKSPQELVSSFVLKNLNMTDLDAYPVSVFDLDTQRLIPLRM